MLFGISIWLQNINIIHVGMYFEGEMISRAIFILRAFFDSGTLTFLILWYIKNERKMSSQAILISYFMLAIIVFGLSTYFWSTTMPTSETKQEDEMMRSSQHSLIGLKMTLLEAEEVIQENVKRNSTVLTSIISGDLDGILKGMDKEHEENMKKKSSEQALEESTGEVTPSSHYILVADRRSPNKQLLSTPFLLLCLFLIQTVLSSLILARRIHEQQLINPITHIIVKDMGCYL